MATRAEAICGLLVLVALTIPSARADVEIVKSDPLPRLNGSWCDIRLRGDIAPADAIALDASERSLSTGLRHRRRTFTEPPPAAG